MGASPVRFALLAIALLLCLYLPQVALDMVRRARTNRHARPWGAVMGGSVAWGTSLWAALLFTLLARHGALELSPLHVQLRCNRLLLAQLSTASRSVEDRQ